MSLGQFPLNLMLRTNEMTRARRFYQETLGLREAGPNEEGTVTLQAGGSTTITLYEGPPSKADHTLGVFLVKNLEETIKNLKAKGVRFENYDQPELKTVNHVSTGQHHKIAWFRDPDGNFLALMQMT